jgi:hypothetical protein
MRMQEWHDRAILTPGLKEIDRAILAAICAWYRRLQAWDYVGSLSYRRIAQSIGADPVPVRWAVERLVGLGLLAVKPGNGARANTYRIENRRKNARRLEASLAAVAADDVPPF